MGRLFRRVDGIVSTTLSYGSALALMCALAVACGTSSSGDEGSEEPSPASGDGDGDVTGDGDAAGDGDGDSEPIGSAFDPVSAVSAVSGFAQKGPLVQGSGLTLQVLDDTMTQTGDSYSADIQDDDGFFTLGNVDLESNQFLEIFADGFYFNEVSGEISDDRLELFAIADTQSGDININVLSHLERLRVKYLYANPDQITDYDPDDPGVGGAGGLSENSRSYQAAKAQAQSEVLAIFGMESLMSTLGVSESLDVSGTNEGDQILTAISAIVQSYRSVGEMTELLSQISTDLETDGQIDDTELLDELYTGAVFLGTDGIAENLIERFDSLTEDNGYGFIQHIESFVAEGEGTRVLVDGPEFTPQAIINEVDTLENVLSDALTCVPDTRAGITAHVSLVEGFELEVEFKALSGDVRWTVDDRFITNFVSQGEEEGDTGPVERFNTLPQVTEADLFQFRLFGEGEFQVSYFANGLPDPYLVRTVQVGSCEVACTENSDCAENLYCGGGNCVGCQGTMSASFQCAPNETAEIFDIEWIEGGGSCFTGVCHPCEGEACDGLAECSRDQHCEDGEECAGGTCVVAVPECIVDGDCDAEQYCFESACEPCEEEQPGSCDPEVQEEVYPGCFTSNCVAAE